MPKTKKYTLKVVFGEKASNYAGSYGYAKTKKQIEKGELEGFAHEYTFETEADRETAIEMINDSDGWLGTYWQKR